MRINQASSITGARQVCHNESALGCDTIGHVGNRFGGPVMPLLDHFHPPLAPRRHWESFHVNWAGAMADTLNDQLLPDGYFAEEHAQLGARVEIDVATFAESDRDASPPRDGATATIPVRVWTPPALAVVIPAAFPDSFEVLVFQSEGGTRLVGAIELVSPANKDRDSHRQAFVIKCASYLCQGISLAIVDIVTSRQANLHNQMMHLLGQNQAAMPADVDLYAADTHLRPTPSRPMAGAGSAASAQASRSTAGWSGTRDSSSHFTRSRRAVHSPLASRTTKRGRRTPGRL